MSSTSTTDDELIASLSSAHRNILDNCASLGSVYLAKGDAEHLSKLGLVSASEVAKPGAYEAAHDTQTLYVRLGEGCARATLTKNGRRVHRALLELWAAEEGAMRKAPRRRR